MWTRERERCYRATALLNIAPTGMWYEAGDLQNIHTSPTTCVLISPLSVCVQVIGLVLQGRMDEARQVLSKQASLRADSSSVFKRMDTLLQSMPIFNVRTVCIFMRLIITLCDISGTQVHLCVCVQPAGTQTLTEFEVKWRNWHEECDRCLEDNTFASNPHLETICKVRVLTSADLPYNPTDTVIAVMCLSDSAWWWRRSAGTQRVIEHVVSLPGEPTALLSPDDQTAWPALLRPGKRTRNTEEAARTPDDFKNALIVIFYSFYMRKASIFHTFCDLAETRVLSCTCKKSIVFMF